MVFLSIPFLFAVLLDLDFLHLLYLVFQLIVGQVVLVP